MIYVVALRAVYVVAGGGITQQRRNQVASDMAQAQTALDAVSGFPVPVDDEWLRTFENRYGFGWEMRQYISVRADSDQVGRTIWSRLATRNLVSGTQLQVFEHFADEGNEWGTGAVLYQQTIPPQADDMSAARV